MVKTREQLENALNMLEDSIPRWMKERRECDVMEEVSVEIEQLQKTVHLLDRSYFRRRVQCILRDAGLVQADGGAPHQAPAPSG